MIKKSLINIYKNTVMELAKSSTCNRAKVGAILLKDNRIICSSYNGSLSSHVNCDEKGHFIVKGHCIRTIHAEMNIICFCAKNGISMNNLILLTSHYPCEICTKLLYQSGINEIYYINKYRNKDNHFSEIIKIEQI